MFFKIVQIATSKSRDIEVGGRRAPVSWTATLGILLIFINITPKIKEKL